MTPLENLEARVEAWLGQQELASESVDLPPVLRSESALVVPSCFLHEGAAWCRFTAIVLVEVEPSLPLLYRLLAMNNAALLGAFRLFEDRCLVYSATLPGSTLDAETFTFALRHVAAMADAHAPELRAVAGGRPAVQLTREEAPCGSPS